MRKLSALLSIFCVILAAPANAAIDEKTLSPIELLGKRVFEDANLSEPRGVSCASCHNPDKAFTGNNNSPIPALALGSKPKSLGNRNTPTLMYAALTPPFSFVDEKNEKGEIEHTPTGGFFHDGRADTLAGQAAGPLLNPIEMNNTSKKMIVEKVKASSYAPMFVDVYGTDVFKDTDTAFDTIMNVLAAFESTDSFLPFSSKFDDYLRGKTQLSQLEKAGFELFKNPEKGNCIACHIGKEDSHNPRDWLFTDYTYDTFGLPRNTATPDNKNPAFHDLGLCQQPGLAKKLPKGVTLASLCGAFKVPTLRNIALTAPYGHNGVFSNLHDIVAFYATRDTNPAEWYPVGTNGKSKKFNDLPAKFHANVNTSEAPYDRKEGEAPRLNSEEITALVAFLDTLSDH